MQLCALRAEYCIADIWHNTAIWFVIVIHSWAVTAELLVKSGRHIYRYNGCVSSANNISANWHAHVCLYKVGGKYGSYCALCIHYCTLSSSNAIKWLHRKLWITTLCGFNSHEGSRNVIISTGTFCFIFSQCCVNRMFVLWTVFIPDNLAVLPQLIAKEVWEMWI